MTSFIWERNCANVLSLTLFYCCAANQGCCITEHTDATGLHSFLSTGTSRSSWSLLNSLTVPWSASSLQHRAHILLIDHQLCWIQTIKGECQGRWAHNNTVQEWALSGREDSSTTVGPHNDDSSVLNTHNLSLRYRASLCAAECVSSSTWEVSSFWVIGPQPWKCVWFGYKIWAATWWEWPVLLLQSHQ